MLLKIRKIYEDIILKNEEKIEKLIYIMIGNR